MFLLSTCCLFACIQFSFVFFFFNDTATTEIYTLSLHDALPISKKLDVYIVTSDKDMLQLVRTSCSMSLSRSEEHTSELQSRLHLVCRLLLEKKKKKRKKQSLRSNISCKRLSRDATS